MYHGCIVPPRHTKKVSPRSYRGLHRIHQVQHLQVLSGYSIAIGGRERQNKIHVNNSKDLAEEFRDITLDKQEMLVSFDVVSLFTNTPIGKSIEIVKDRLQNDTELHKRTKLSVEDIIKLLEFILSTTYFSFDRKIYRQKFGAAMGNPVSPIVANIYMEHLEQEAIAMAQDDIEPRVWKRYVDDILAIVKRDIVDRLKACTLGPGG